MTGRTITVDEGRVNGYITTAEFAKECGVEVVTVRQWIRRGKVNPVKIGSQNFIRLGTEKPGRKRRNNND